jgi:hypothetical protein
MKIQLIAEAAYVYCPVVVIDNRQTRNFKISSLKNIQATTLNNYITGINFNMLGVNYIYPRKYPA